jgi:hypothetical protein
LASESPGPAGPAQQGIAAALLPFFVCRTSEFW